MKTPWTCGEKWLWTTPLLFAVVAFAFMQGPQIVRQRLGWARELATTPDNQLSSLVLSRDGSVLAATGYDVSSTGLARAAPPSGTVYLWDAHTLQPLKPFAPQLYKGGRSRGWVASSLAISPDGQLIGMGNRGAPGYAVYEVATQNLLWRTPSGTSYAQFSADGRFIALGRFEFREARTGKLVTSWKARNGSLGGFFSLSPNAKTLACIGAERQPTFASKSSNVGSVKAPSVTSIELRRVSDGKIVRVLPDSQDTETVAFSPDGTKIVSLAQGELTLNAVDGTVVRCHSISGKLLWQRDFRRSPQQQDGYKIFCDAVFSPDGHSVALRDSKLGAQILLLNASNGSTQKQLVPAKNQSTNFLVPSALAFSLDGKQLFARGKNAVLVWDLE